MKAQFVYEALDFERGGDVKSKIGIGASVIWKKFRNQYPWATLDDILQLGLSLNYLLTEDPDYFIKRKYDLIKWMRDKRITEDDKKILEDLFLEFYEKDVKEDPGQSITAKADQLVHANSMKELKAFSPRIAQAIIDYPLPFLYQGVDNNSSFANDVYKNYFDPLKYKMENIYRALYLESFSQIFKDFPEYYKSFREEATIGQKLEVGDKHPEFIEDIIKNNEPIGDTPDPYYSNIYKLIELLREVHISDTEKIKNIATLIRRYLKSDNKDKKEFYSSKKKLKGKNLLNKAGKYYSDLL